MFQVAEKGVNTENMYMYVHPNSSSENGGHYRMLVFYLFEFHGL